MRQKDIQDMTWAAYVEYVKKFRPYGRNSFTGGEQLVKYAVLPCGHVGKHGESFCLACRTGEVERGR